MGGIKTKYLDVFPPRGTFSLGMGGGEVEGDLNVRDRASASVALAEAFTKSRRVALIPSATPYTFPTPVAVTQDDCVLEADACTLRPTSTVTGSGSFLEVTGDGFKMIGGRIALTVFTENQYVIRLNAVEDARIIQTLVDDNIRPSSYTNPMILFRIDGCDNPRFDSIRVAPDRGLMVYNPRASFNVVIEESMIGGRWTEELLMHQAFEIADCQHTQIRGGWMMGVGTAAERLAFVLRCTATVGSSATHLHVDGGFYEGVKVARGFQVSGQRHALFENMEIAGFSETDVGVFCAVGSSGDATGTAVYSMEIQNCRGHDNGKLGSSGALVYSRLSSQLKIERCRNLDAFGPAARIDQVNSTGVMMANNFFQTAQPEGPSDLLTRNAVIYIGSASTPSWRFQNNTVVGSGANGYNALHATPPTSINESDTLVIT